MLTAEEITKNYEKHLKIIDTYITERKDKVKSMIEPIGDEYVMAPASGRAWFHNAFPGGYVDHVNRVVEYAVKQMRLYKEMGGEVDFTEEELVFAALFHDLGKLGDGDGVVDVISHLTTYLRPINGEEISYQKCILTIQTWILCLFPIDHCLFYKNSALHLIKKSI